MYYGVRLWVPTYLPTLEPSTACEKPTYLPTPRRTAGGPPLLPQRDGRRRALRDPSHSPAPGKRCNVGAGLRIVYRAQPLQVF